MATIKRLAVCYLLLINALGLLLMLLDKRYAKKHRRRIPEATLMAVAALGGSAGGLAGMYLFHHKTKHPKFYIGIPVLLILQLALALYLTTRDFML